MRKLTLLLLSFFLTGFSFAEPVTLDEARIVADNYFSFYSVKMNPALIIAFSVQYNGIIVYHVFNYSGGGFVAVAADDAVTPVLAESDEGYLEGNIINPNAKYWFESYGKEIVYIITAGLDNKETLRQWNRIRNNEFDPSARDVGLLLTTTWDQGQWYNYYCPAAFGSLGGHVWAGCVATSMGQIMKYHSFPEHGVLSHTYEHPIYGTQTANFGETTYNWGAMGNSANSSSYQDIAMLLYHAGVSVDMNYDPDGSGAPSNNVPWALTTYFNYDPSTIGKAFKADYSDTEWKELLKADLNASLPLYYSGDDVSSGHAWVCDGWRSGDDMFHMNWGWSGTSNGWYAMGALNPDFNNFNNSNLVVKGIKPGNPALIVRITNLLPSSVIGYGPVAGIDCSVITGTPNAVNLYFDNGLIYSTIQTNFTHDLVTSDYPMGIHTIKVEALNATDTVFHEITVGNFGWAPQASAFANAARGIQQIYAVDSLIVWAIAYDGDDLTNYIQEFTRTENGGETWTSGTIPGCAGLTPSMIFALNDDTAYCPMFRQSGANPQGIYVTMDGGINWTKQTSASFSNSASFPNVVHFFNNYEGFCMGDPVSGEFEIYTTNDGGNTWTQVNAENIPDPLSGEFGVIGYYSAVGNKAWFGTNKGRVYRTSDKGLQWDVSTTTLAGKYVDVEFANGLHGLAQDKNLNTTGALSETFDGGVTWNAVTVTGQVGTTDFCFVPGTENTWISTEANILDGTFYSFDGGHSWALFAVTNDVQYLAVDFVSNRSGWAGGFNESATAGGMFRFVGALPPGTTLGPVTSLYAVATGWNVNLEWTAPTTGNVIGYNVYRDDTLRNTTPVINYTYNDYPVANGKHTYCVTAVYDAGESDAVCTDAWVTFGIAENEADVKVYPNPAAGLINIETPQNFSLVRILTLAGQEVYNYAIPGNNLRILTAGFIPGMYVMQITMENNTITCKISVK